MAQASATIIPGYTLNATTPAPGEAPVTYAINGVVVGTDTTANINAGAIGLFFNTIANPDGTYTITAGQSTTKVFTGTQAQAASFTAGIEDATESVLNGIHTSVVTAPAPAPEPPPAPVAVAAAPVPAPEPPPAPVAVAAAPVPAPATTTDPSINATATENAAPKTNPDTTTSPSTAAGATANVVPQTGTTASNSGQGTTAAKADAQSTPATQEQTNAVAQKDWRVRVALSPDLSVTYLYKDPENALLSPLRSTSGVIFPYTPTISASYAAQYDPTTLVHNNYKVYQYGSSSVDNISITGDFTCQDVAEANYVMAVIHFFRTMTKMFYGQDTNPKPGTPPPLCYLYGLGQYQFDGQPMAIQSFTYATPLDVDYIATTGPAPTGTPQKNINPNAKSNSRIGAESPLAVGGTSRPVKWPSTPVSAGQGATYVPTKINISISCVPMMSRNQVSNVFNLKDYASGKLLKGTQNGTGAFW